MTSLRDTMASSLAYSTSSPRAFFTTSLNFIAATRTGTPLMVAAYHGDEAMVHLLCSHSAPAPEDSSPRPSLQTRESGSHGKEISGIDMRS